MKRERFRTESPEETERLGSRLARELRPGDIVGLVGELGTGKTTFVRGLARGLGLGPVVRSPSFSIINIYENAPPLFHIDLYRISGPDEFYDAGLGEYIYSKGVSVIEWADAVPGLLDECTVVVWFSHGDGPLRIIEIEKRTGERDR